MRYLMLLLLLALCTLSVGANDARVVGQGGRVRLVTGEKTSVHMVREQIRIEVFPKYYDVTVDFLFQNDGPGVTVQMGFPERGYGDVNPNTYLKKSGFLSFHTWVDDKEVIAVRKGGGLEEDGYKAFWVKSVSFTRGQAHRVRVAYRSELGDDTTNDHLINYPFTGGNWAGQVKESSLQVTFHLPDTIVIEMEKLPNANKIVSTKWQGNTFSARWKNWQAEGEFGLSFRSTFPGWLAIDGFRGSNTDTDYSKTPVKSVTLTQPGTTPTLDWLPPAVERDHVTYISLDALSGYLNNMAETAKQPQRTDLTWDSNTATASLRAGNHSIGFQMKKTEMLVDGTKNVPLSVRPFLSRPLTESVSGGHLYVPLKAVLSVFGGVVHENLASHSIKLTIPPFWQ